MQIDFLYGKNGLSFELDDKLDINVLEPDELNAIKDPVDEIYQNCIKPMNSKSLPQLLKKCREGNIVIVVEDHTRPMPSVYPLNALIKIFDELHIPDNRVKILVGTGLHRSPKPDELSRMVGEEVINRYDIIFHDATDMLNLKFVGKTSFENDVYLNNNYLDASLRIVTGYVEPHFFAGFSGGRKALVPGIAGQETILSNHSAKNIDSGAHFGVLKGNPVHEDALEVARMKDAKPEFCINVTLNSNHKITNVACGNIVAVHNYLVQQQRKNCFKELNKKYDVVICGNGGYPLDLNLYQAVKSMAIGEMAGKENGYIISVNECSDGVGQDKFDELINCGKSPEEIYNDAISGRIKVPDIWEIQILARILMKHNIYVVSEMKKGELGNIGLRYAKNVQSAINEIIQESNKEIADTSVLVLPKGPLILPVML
ncbi:MAG: nickel-dependent lactate racemase [Candidatus Lokiarchaeota archaeon]|nr:nickel-dependent lactate racemase [Candidatus Lokiarchaeota archaeon]